MVPQVQKVEKKVRPVPKGLGELVVRNHGAKSFELGENWLLNCLDLTYTCLLGHCPASGIDQRFYRDLTNLGWRTKVPRPRLPSS